MDKRTVVMLVGALLLTSTITSVVVMAGNDGGSSNSGSTGASEGVLLLTTDGTIRSKGHIVGGRVVAPAGLGATVTFSGAAAFSSAESYSCFFNEFVGPYQRIDGKQIVVPRQTNVGPVTINFICVGD